MTNTLTSVKEERGLSLIEVMASVLIMGTLIASMLTSMAGSVRQISNAEAQLTASHLARELLADWSLRKEDLTVSTSGTIAALSGWSWTRSAQLREVMPGITISEVTLTVARSANESQMKPCRYDFKVWINKPATRMSG